MAYLNVRERRIETKIAYVGGDFVAENLEALKTATRGARSGSVESHVTTEGEMLSLAWQPADRSLFRDCDVLVKIVALGGPIAELGSRETLRDVDGVVIVMDASPDAREQNRESLVAVNDALERNDRAAVPCVIQVNQSDAVEALAPAEVLESLAASRFRHVSASTARGEGVLETLEAALAEVLARMQQEPSAEEPRGGETLTPAPGEHTHPLLASLRHVLRETVADYAADLETRVTANLERSLLAIQDAATRGLIDLSEDVAALRIDIERLHAERRHEQVERGADTTIERIERVKDELAAEITRLGDELRRSRKGWFT